MYAAKMTKDYFPKLHFPAVVNWIFLLRKKQTNKETKKPTGGGIN